MLKNIFWNGEEKRLRAFWRLFIQTILFVLLSGIISGGAIVFAIFFLGVDASLFSGADESLIMNAIDTDLTLTLLITFSALASTVISVWLAGKFLDRRRFIDFGFHLNRHWWEDFAFGLTLGAFLMTVIFFIEAALGWIEIKGFLVSSKIPFGLAIVAGFINFVSVGIREEVLSRGYHLINIAEGLKLPAISPKTALILAYIFSSVVFGLMHLGNPNTTLISTINLMLAGIFLGLGYILTKELAIPIGLHITWNFFQGKVFGFPVSGLTTTSTVIAIEQKGPDLWSGGVFGPEAGLLGLLMIGLGCLLTVLWVLMRKDIYANGVSFISSGNGRISDKA